MNALTDAQACLRAKIGVRTLYDYCEQNPEFSQRKELLKKEVSAMAKENLVKSIKKGNLQISKWWLERKEREEFATLQQLGGQSNVNSIAGLFDAIDRRGGENETDAYAD